MISFGGVPSGSKAGDYKATVTGPSGSTIDAVVEEDTEEGATAGSFIVKFLYGEEGEYEIVVYGPGGSEVIRQRANPSTGTVVSGAVQPSITQQVATAASKGAAVVADAVTSVVSGSAATGRGKGAFIVQFEGPEGRRAGDFTAVVKRPNGTQYDAVVEADSELGGNNYQIRVELEQEGDYEIIVYGPGGVEVIRQSVNPITGESKVVSSAAQSTSKSASATGSASASGAGRRRTARYTHFCCGIEVLDEQGNAVSNGGDAVEVKVEGGKGASGLKGTVKDQGNGKYICSFVPTEAGRYTIHILIDGQEIDGSPYYLERK